MGAMSFDGRRQELLEQFRNQQKFATAYSPLYAKIFGTVAGWLEHNGSDPLIVWLVETTAERPAFDVTLLLMANLHRLVLAGDDAVSDLAAAYPTAGGAFPMSSSAQFDLEDALYEAIMAHRPMLGEFLVSGRVQTNETARGLVWLLPASWTGWREMHLVELGASAGLNLVAEQRGYVLSSKRDGEGPTIRLGSGSPRFRTYYTNPAPRLADPHSRLPYIVSRTGGDIAPFPLDTVDDEIALASFVWGDQTERLSRLWEGIEAYRRIKDTAAPVHVHYLDLSTGLSAFLQTAVPRTSHVPVLVYNTTVSVYLPDRGRALRTEFADWAMRQSGPVLWAQWELPLDETETPPENGWMAWTVDLWASGVHHHWRIAWIHPHGVEMRWEPGAAQLAGRLEKGYQARPDLTA